MQCEMLILLFILKTLDNPLKVYKKCQVSKILRNYFVMSLVQHFVFALLKRPYNDVDVVRPPLLSLLCGKFNFYEPRTM